MNDRYRSSFLSIKRTLPWVLRTLKTELFSLGSSSGQQMVTVKEQIARNLRHFIDEEWQHEYFGIVENVTQIAKTGKTFGRNAIPAIMRRGVDAQLVNIITDGLLCPIVSLDNDVRLIPEFMPRLFMLCAQCHVRIKISRGSR